MSVRASTQLRARYCSRYERLALAALTLFYLVGIVSHLIARTRPLMMQLTPAVLLLSGAAVLAVAASAKPAGRFWLWWGAVTLFTFAVEVVGVATGFVFGRYSYGEVLGAKLLGVPPVIGFNWSLVALGSVLLADRTRRMSFARQLSAPARIVIVAVLAGLISALFDAIMEPSAVGLGYWSWQGSEIPLRNYGAWFLLSGMAATGYQLLRIRLSAWLPIAYLFLQGLFFAALDLALPAHIT